MISLFLVSHCSYNFHFLAFMYEFLSSPAQEKDNWPNLKWDDNPIMVFTWVYRRFHSYSHLHVKERCPTLINELHPHYVLHSLHLISDVCSHLYPYYSKHGALLGFLLHCICISSFANTRTSDFHLCHQTSKRLNFTFKVFTCL